MVADPQLKPTIARPYSTWYQRFVLRSVVARQSFYCLYAMVIYLEGVSGGSQTKVEGALLRSMEGDT